MKCPQCSSPLEFRAPRCSACGSSVHLTSVTTVSGHLAILEDPALLFPPGALLAERFTILEKAGDGGMGIVYKAFDTSLDQEVALKLIRADLAGDEDFVDSFKQEVRLTRQIAHPNVCRVHDLGDSHGLLFFSMEWLEGETLSQKLKQQPVMAPERALEIAEGIAQALGAAHTRGIVHRDLKPSNVMIDGAGAVHVMDFGIAVGPGSTAESPSGTPAYMSPEQWRGERPDARSDLYSLGLILMEMLGYQPPGAGERVAAQLPPALRRKLGPILKSLLAEDKEARCPSAEKAVEALRMAREGSGFYKRRGALRSLRLRWMLSAAGVVLAGALGFYWEWGRGPGPSPPQPESPGWAYYQRGLQYLQEEDTLRGLDDATHMLHRATEADPNLAPAWARLAEAYWARYERTRENSSREEALQAVQKAIQLDPQLAEAQYARGRGLIAEGRYPEAKETLEQVVKLEPRLDIAWANLGWACKELQDYPRGINALETAIRLKPRNFRHQIYLGLFFYKFGEYGRAAQAYRKALELKPTSTTALDNLGATFIQLGRPQDAAAALKESLKIEEGAAGYSNLGNIYFYEGKYEDAVNSYRRATELDPKNADLWGNLGDGMKMLNREQESHSAYLQAVDCARAEAKLVPGEPTVHLKLGLYCARARNEACALSEGNLAVQLQPESPETLFRDAVIHCIFGRTNEALDRLEKAVRLGLTRIQIQNDPDLSPLHGNPRYDRILELAS